MAPQGIREGCTVNDEPAWKAALGALCWLICVVAVIATAYMELNPKVVP